MRVAILADGRSPTSQGWLAALIDLGYQVHLISTFPCDVDLNLASYHFVPVAFSGVGSLSRTAGAPGGAGAIGLRAAIRRTFGWLTFPLAIQRLRTHLRTLDVDLLHALRIPYEGMLASQANPGLPLIVSVWGNDFTLHAISNPRMGNMTRRAISRTDGLHADCQRDISLAQHWGLPEGRPTFIAPGSGGLDRRIFNRRGVDSALVRPELTEMMAGIDPDDQLVVNARGFRAYVRNDTFFQSIPIILAQKPQTLFLAPAMQDEPHAQQWLSRLAIGEAVRLLPKLSPVEMAYIYRHCQVAVSPSEHDGTPNSFLEAIACGCFPIVGDLESLREWIEDGQNGFLVDPADPVGLAQRVIQALGDPELRSHASLQNQELVDKRAERGRVAGQLDHFYREVLDARPNRF